MKDQLTDIHVINTYCENCHIMKKGKEKNFSVVQYRGIIDAVSENALCVKRIEYFSYDKWLTKE